MLVITATSTDAPGSADVFRNTLIELGLLAATVIAMAIAIFILRFSQRKYVDDKPAGAIEHAYTSTGRR